MLPLGGWPLWLHLCTALPTHSATPLPRMLPVLQKGAKVFSMSLGLRMGDTKPDQLTIDMFQRIKDAGALVVAAAGNGAVAGPPAVCLVLRRFRRSGDTLFVSIQVDGWAGWTGLAG